MVNARQLFDDGVVVVARDPREITDPRRLVTAKEWAAVARAVDKRQREFAAGRDCARKAIAGLGLGDAVEICSREDRAPIWPAGVVGSIAHTDSHCVAVAAAATSVRSLGVDVEVNQPLADELCAKICTSAELRRLAVHSVSERRWLGKLIFSAKESAYKCQYPITETYLGFHAMEIELLLDAQRFVARFRQQAGVFAAGDCIEGRYVFDDVHIFTGCALPGEAS